MTTTPSNLNPSISNKTAPPLWNVSLEQKLVKDNHDSWMATISCKSGCGFTQRAFFGTRSKTCPNCKTSTLEVNGFNQRNTLVSEKTERFVLNLFRSVIAQDPKVAGKHFVKRGLICKPLGLNGSSGADLAILNQDKDGPVPVSAIECLFEIKMSIIWNWRETNLKVPIADYDGSAGRPSIFRTDSILKAIGKASVTRGYDGSEQIPFVVIGNAPVPKGYRDKVDKTVSSGLIQKWISLTPKPLIVEPKRDPQTRDPKKTAGFLRIDSIAELQELLTTLLSGNWRYMSNMVDPAEVGRVIKSLDLNRPPEQIGYEFLRRLPEASITALL